MFTNEAMDKQGLWYILTELEQWVKKKDETWSFGQGTAIAIRNLQQLLEPTLGLYKNGAINS